MDLSDLVEERCGVASGFKVTLDNIVTSLVHVVQFPKNILIQVRLPVVCGQNILTRRAGDSCRHVGNTI